MPSPSRAVGAPSLSQWERVFAFLAALFLIFLPAPAFAQSFPQFSGLVTDAAGVLPADRKAALEQKLEAFQQQTGRQLVVATIPDLQGYAIEDYGYRLGRAWGVGLKGADNGAILIVAPKEHKVRVEVGTRLEPVLTDAFSSVIIQTRIVPAFKAGDIPGGVEAGADALIQQLSLPDDQARAETAKAATAFDATHRRSRHSGGGAPLGVIVWLVIMGVIVASHFGRRAATGPWGGRRYSSGGGSNWPIWLWAASEIMDSNRRSGGGGGGGGLLRWRRVQRWRRFGWQLGRWRLHGRRGRRLRRRRRIGKLVMLKITPSDAAHVAAAIKAAEARTDGEVQAFVAAASDSYAEVPLHYALLLALLPLAISAAFPGLLEWSARLIHPGWEEPSQRFVLTLLMVKTISAFLMGRYLFGIQAIRLALTPAKTKHRRVHRRALMLFRAAIEQRTATTTGVLLYLSLAERRAEIVADAAIHAKVDDSEWGEAMAVLLDAVKDGRPGDGIAAAIGKIGDVLAAHFPRTGTDPNELPDRLIVL